MVEIVTGVIAGIALLVYSLITFDREHCGGEWIKPDFSGKYLPAISKH